MSAGQGAGSGQRVRGRPQAALTPRVVSQETGTPCTTVALAPREASQAGRLRSKRGVRSAPQISVRFDHAACAQGGGGGEAPLLLLLLWVRSRPRS